MSPRRRRRWFDRRGPAPFDVAVIGAGPAGLAAAVAAVAGDARVVLLDAAPRLGGQYWRHRPGDDGTRHHDWHAFAGLREAAGTAVAAGTLVHLAGVHGLARRRATADGFVVHAPGRRPEPRRSGRATRRPRHRRVRPPAAVPGLDPARRATPPAGRRRCSRARRRGGAAGRRRRDRAVPAAGRDRAGRGGRDGRRRVRGRPADRASRASPLTVLRSRGEARARAPGTLRALRATASRTAPARRVIEAHGDEAGHRRHASPGWTPAGASCRAPEQALACDAVAVGYGFTPQPELALQLGCAHALDADGSLVATVDDDQREHRRRACSWRARPPASAGPTGAGGGRDRRARGRRGRAATDRRSRRDATGRAATGPRPRVRRGPPGGVPGARRLARLADAGRRSSAAARRSPPGRSARP